MFVKYCRFKFEYKYKDISMAFYLSSFLLFVSLFLCGSVVEHCVSSAKGCGFDSQGTHILIKKKFYLNEIVSRFG